MTEGHGIASFDLQAPAQLLTGFTPKYHGLRTRTVTLGSSGDTATLEVTTWDKCLGCGTHVLGHKAGRDVRLKVPCDSLPHCNACECGDSHSLLVADDQVAELLAALS